MPTVTTQEIDSFIAANEDAILRDIARLIAVQSHRPEKVPEALAVVLSIAEGMGLSVTNDGNRIAWAELPGEREAYIATIAHTDVVPPGEGWNTDPFTLTREGDWLIGRGIVDDKGAAVLSLYALKFLQEQGLPLRYPVRALFGTDEETGMTDVDYYLKHYPAPAFCFTPDADFPLCNGEKGHYTAVLLSPPISAGDILAFEGGFAPNAIPGTARATVRLRGKSWQKAAHVTAEIEGDTARLTAAGISGHASLPEGAVNAIGLLVNALLQNGIGNAAEASYLQCLQKLHAAYDGSTLGMAADDGHFSPLTVIGGMIGLTAGGRIRQTLDSRFPTSTGEATITAALKAALGEAAEIAEIHSTVPFYIAEDHPAIQACLSAYAGVTGEDARPFTMGGGTYARHFPAAVSFGPQPHDLVRPQTYGTEHGANEALPFSALLRALKIYITALLQLQALPEL